MPITKSAIKRARQDAQKRIRRVQYRTHMKTMMRKVMASVKTNDVEKARSLLPLAYKAIDTAAKKHIIHHKNADRKKALLAKLAMGSTSLRQGYARQAGSPRK